MIMGSGSGGDVGSLSQADIESWKRQMAQDAEAQAAKEKKEVAEKAAAPAPVPSAASPAA